VVSHIIIRHDSHALGRGALPRLQCLWLHNATIGDAGLVALAPALRRLPALELISLYGNPFGDEGLAALVAPPPPPEGALPPPTKVLAKLKALYLGYTQINDAGCAALAAALDSGAFPALEVVYMNGIPASAAEEAVVCTGAHSLESRHLRDGPRPAARCECVALITLASRVPACEVR